MNETEEMFEDIFSTNDQTSTQKSRYTVSNFHENALLPVECSPLQMLCKITILNLKLNREKDSLG